jgi:hypothetical protein
MHRVILAAKSKQGVPKGRAQVRLGSKPLPPSHHPNALFLVCHSRRLVSPRPPEQQRSMAIKSTSQRRSFVEEPEESESCFCVPKCRRRKRNATAGPALVGRQPSTKATTVDDGLPFSSAEEVPRRCLPMSPLSPGKLFWDLLQLVGSAACAQYAVERVGVDGYQPSHDPPCPPCLVAPSLAGPPAVSGFHAPPSSSV